MVELMNKVKGKDKSCLEYWVDLNSRAAENKNGSEIEQLLIMAKFLSGTTNEKLVEKCGTLNTTSKNQKRQ